MENAQRADKLDARSLLALVEAGDAFRRPQRLADLMDAAEAESFGARRWADVPFPPRHAVKRALALLAGVDAASIASQGGDIGARLRAARAKALGA